MVLISLNVVFIKSKGIHGIAGFFFYDFSGIASLLA